VGGKTNFARRAIIIQNSEKGKDNRERGARKFIVTKLGRWAKHNGTGGRRAGEKERGEKRTEGGAESTDAQSPI